MYIFKVRFVIFFISIIGLLSHTIAQYNIDSLINELPNSDSKAEIYNLMAEATIEDSLELSRDYAKRAFNCAISEKNQRQEGIALFNIAEVFSYQYHHDSAVHNYQNALTLLKLEKDNYYISYTLNNLGWINNTYGKYQQAIDHYTESIQYLDAEENAEDLAYVFLNIGNSYHSIGKYQTAINYFHKAASILRKLGDESALPFSYTGLGLSYKYLSNFDSAIYYYNLSLELDKELENLYSQAIDYSNIGALYFQFEQFDQSFNFYKLTLQIHQKQGTKNDLSITYNNIGEIYKVWQKYDSALFYLNKALEIDKETGIEQNMAHRYHNLGDVYYDQKNYQKALQHFNKSLQINKEIGSKYNIALNLSSIAQVNQKTGNNSEAEKLFREGLSIAQNINSRSLVLSILEAMSLFYQETHQYKEALHYHAMIDELNDSLFKEKSQQLLADLQTKHDLDQKQKEIALLNSENKLHKKEAEQYRKSTLFFGITLLVIFSMLLILYYQYNLRKKAYIKLLERNTESLEHDRQFKALLKQSGDPKAEKQKSKEPNGLHRKLMNDVLDYFENEKPYINQDIQIKFIADQLNSNPKYISQAINANFNKNFNTFVNEYRIKLAMKYLANGVKKQYSIEGISDKVGFHSKSAFNVAFKKMTGITPSFYIKSYKN